MGKHKLWTVVDDNYIIANYSKKTATQLASKLNTTQNAVYGRVKKLGLSKNQVNHLYKGGQIDLCELK